MSKKIKWASLAISMCVLASAARGGEVVFKNGDRITGEVIDLGGGKLKIKSAIAGDITVDLKDVATFTTDKPVELKLKDGTVVGLQAGASTQPGTIVSAPTTQPIPSNAAVPPTTAPAGKILSIDQFDSIISAPPTPAWTGSITAGATFSRGNTDTDQYHLGFDALRRYTDDRITTKGEYNLGDQKNQGDATRTTSTDNWYVQGQFDHFVSKKFYEYGNLKFEHDRIAQLYLRTSPGVGMGYQWIETPAANFSTEGGLGYTDAKYDGGMEDTYINARLAYHYDRQLTSNTKFVHNLEYLPSMEDVKKFNIDSDAGIRVALTEQFFTEFKVEWKYDSQPASGAQQNDYRYILSLGWRF
jgi:putative salt-induced outer membrane protein YdiY